MSPTSWGSWGTWMNTKMKGTCSHPCPLPWVHRIREYPELIHKDHQVLSLPRSSPRIPTMWLRELSKVKGRWKCWRKSQKKKKKELRSRKLVGLGFLGKPLEWPFLYKVTLEYWSLGQGLKILFAFLLFQDQQQNRRLCWVFPEGFSRTYHLCLQQFTPEPHTQSLSRIPGPFSVGCHCLLPHVTTTPFIYLFTCKKSWRCE